MISQLTTLMLLGSWWREQDELNRAVQAIPEDPAQWTGNTGTQIWSSRIAAQLTDQVPRLIQDMGIRPADAVARLIQETLVLGIEIGRQVERGA